MITRKEAHDFLLRAKKEEHPMWFLSSILGRETCNWVEVAVEGEIC